MNGNEMKDIVKMFKANSEEKIRIYNRMEERVNGMCNGSGCNGIGDEMMGDKQSTHSVSTNTTKEKISMKHPVSRNMRISVNQIGNKTLTKTPSYSKACYYDFTVKTIKQASSKTYKHSRSECLYAISKDLNEKLEQKRKDIAMQFKRNSTPKITKKANAIKRDANSFHERLYPNSKSFDDCYNNNNSFYGTNAKHYTKYNNATTHNNSNAMYYNNSLTFTPYINITSKRIASKLEKPSIRLTKRSNKYAFQHFRKNLSSELELLEKKYKKLTSPSFSVSPNNKSNSKNNNSKDDISYTKCISLYNNAMQMKQRKHQKCKEYKQELENQYKAFTFKPKLIPNNIYYRTVFRGGSKERVNDIYNKNTKWKECVQNKTKRIYNQKVKEEMAQCTFKPQINKSVMDNDAEFINRHIDQIVGYVKERRQVLLQKQEDEIYKSKVFYEQYLRPPSNKPKRHLSRQTSVCYLEEEFNSKNFNSQYK